ncbi:DUF2550 domain-containing protein [Solicola sp. PLA-1-18]|uniref:DUF2550 domain-containing protein n=1 Tax=Solicola sp. PLA-1-18 TaxID=3380532 RepID=UPI003B767E47
MPFWLWLLDSFGVIVGVVLLLLLGLVVRRRVVSRHHPTFDLSVNEREGGGLRGWMLGVGRFNDTHLEWFRVFSLSPRPRRRFERGRVEVVRRRDPDQNEAYSLHAGAVIVECTTVDGPVQFALSPSALTGLLAWLESAPPGRDSSRVI